MAFQDWRRAACLTHQSLSELGGWRVIASQAGSCSQINFPTLTQPAGGENFGKYVSQAVGTASSFICRLRQLWPNSGKAWKWSQSTCFPNLWQWQDRLTQSFDAGGATMSLWSGQQWGNCDVGCCHRSTSAGLARWLQRSWFGDTLEHFIITLQYCHSWIIASCCLYKRASTVC